jgi:biotin transport system substrate-specific component
MEMTAAKMRTRDIAYIAVFTALTAVCSWISIPTAIPFTLQTMAVFLAVGLLGGKRGTIAVTAYVLLGAVGAPVFANFSGGVGILLGQTGGYILGFIGSALVMWAMERFLGGKLWGLGLNMLLGLLVCYAFGTAWFMVVYPMGGESVGLWTALTWCVFPYVPFDMVKIALALALTSQLRRHVK